MSSSDLIRGSISKFIAIVKWTPESSPGELLRTIGFSYAPGLIRIFGFNQDLLIITFFGAGIWSLIAMIIAVRQALDYKSTWRAIGVVVIVALFQFYILYKFGFVPPASI